MHHRIHFLEIICTQLQIYSNKKQFWGKSHPGWVWYFILTCKQEIDKQQRNNKKDHGPMPLLQDRLKYTSMNLEFDTLKDKNWSFSGVLTITVLFTQKLIHMGFYGPYRSQNRLFGRKEASSAFCRKIISMSVIIDTGINKRCNISA